MTGGEVLELESVGLLHDIGKVAIEEAILNKPGPLDEDEWEEIRRHPEIGYRILSSVNDMADMARDVLYHHERWDGSGYPRGLAGEEIPLVSRIIHLADAFDAMTSERAYRPPMETDRALEQIRLGCGTQFDPDLVRLFLDRVVPRLGRQGEAGGPVTHRTTASQTLDGLGILKEEDLPEGPEM